MKISTREPPSSEYGTSSGPEAPPACGTAPSVPAPAPASDRGTGTLFGTVTHALSQQPIPGVRITARSPNLEGEQMAVTDAGGNYRLPQLPAGVYALSFTKEELRPAVRCDVSVRKYCVTFSVSRYSDSGSVMSNASTDAYSAAM